MLHNNWVIQQKELAKDPSLLKFNHPHAGIRTRDYREDKELMTTMYQTYNLSYELNIKLTKTKYQINIEDQERTYSFSVSA